ncbi:hypothetical protein HJG60_009843 [Phyllostomus discolor]|uniref:Uncharacterized protein n=1 Tax=Phyllostomus discolor TaxID=89673 RepID=A0A834B6V8_9CHIR|nr:hypothetical protein HJG60_009843 [Phyllostomus discolor]
MWILCHCVLDLVLSCRLCFIPPHSSVNPAGLLRTSSCTWLYLVRAGPLVPGESWDREREPRHWGILGLAPNPCMSNPHSAFLGVFRMPSQAGTICFCGASIPDPRVCIHDHPHLLNRLGLPTCIRAFWGPKGHHSTPHPPIHGIFA